MSPTASSEQALRRMSSQARRETRPEIALRSCLHRNGLRYRTHARVVPGTRRTVDIAFPGSRIAIDVRGCWWHRCPIHSTEAKANAAWWTSKLDANVARDRDTEVRLTKAGWTVIVVWEHEPAAEAVVRIAAALAAGTVKRGISAGS